MAPSCEPTPGLAQSGSGPSRPRESPAGPGGPGPVPQPPAGPGRAGCGVAPRGPRARAAAALPGPKNSAAIPTGGL